MSTVKIKTEPTTTAAVTVGVKVKLEPSLSTADIKLEQHSSDIDTKVESDSEADIESDSEEDIKSENDDDDEDTDQDQFTTIPKKMHKFICKHSGCGRSFNSASSLKRHQRELKLHTELSILGKTFTLTRQSLNDRWICPIPDCTSTAKTVDSLYIHIRAYHVEARRQQQHPSQLTRHSLYFLNADDFYMDGVRCGYHNTTGIFICHECRLVPECLLTHLQQQHGYNEKSIDDSALPEGAASANADPNNNQHTSNSHLALAISQPYQQHHQDIVQGWQCVLSDCGHCGHTAAHKSNHRKRSHNGEPTTTVPALILRLVYGKSNSCCFLITRIEKVTASSNRVIRHRLDYSSNVLNTKDEKDDDISQNETIDATNQERQWRCDYENCRQFFNTPVKLGKHRREHKCKVVINVRSKNITLIRQSSHDRWVCPVIGCEATYKTVDGTCSHIRSSHGTLVKHHQDSSEDDDNQQQQQQQSIKRTRPAIHYWKVNAFNIGSIRCGYHSTTGLLFCYECRLIPECLLTHLQQKHGFDEKSIDNTMLPESARIVGSDPNGNQHISNQHLAPVIGEPNQLQHPDIVQGWLCTASNCCYCCSTKELRSKHLSMNHRGEQVSTVPALVLRLLYGKTQTSFFLITRLDLTTNIAMPSNSTSQYNTVFDDEDGDELVLSDYSD